MQLFTGDIAVHFEGETFTIEASYYTDLTVDCRDIDSVELREQDDPGIRTNGFGSPRLSMGTFQNQEFGSYTRYTYTGGDTCIVLRDGDHVLVLGGEDEAATRAIYQRLEALCRG